MTQTTVNPVLSTIGLDFPRGYCSNEPNCASNIECGPHGRCLAPFRNVTDQTFRDLEGTFDPPLTPGTLDFLGGYGVCLRSCVDGFECFSDQACQLVMDEFVSQVPGSVNTQTFCVPHQDCRFCNSHAHCSVDASDDGQCICNPGYTGNGLTCSATGAGCGSRVSGDHPGRQPGRSAGAGAALRIRGQPAGGAAGCGRAVFGEPAAGDRARVPKPDRLAQAASAGRVGRARHLLR